MVSIRLVVFSALVATAAALTKITQCPGRSFPDVGDIQISCKGNPCKLKKNTDIIVLIPFTPDEDEKTVVNNVSAEVFGVPLPFVGVDGKSICDKIERPDGEKVSCPLRAGTKYIYKDSFPVLSIYPSINVKVHWAIKGGNKDLQCFEVPAKITG